MSRVQRYAAWLVAALLCWLLFLPGVEAAPQSSEDIIVAHLVPHSHDDPGWLRTVDEYHYEYVRYILDEVIDALVANSSRRFIQGTAWLITCILVWYCTTH